MERIRELRKNRGYSRIKFAREMGFSPSSIGSYENGSRMPTIETAKKIAQFFNVSVDYLIGNTDNPDVKPPSDTHLIRDDERRFVKEYRMLQPEDKQLFQQLMDRFPKREKRQDG